VIMSSRPLTRRNGEVINAQALKIGNQVIVYVDEDGKKFGMLERATGPEGEAWTWREDLNLAERTAVKRAIAVKAGRETPQLATLNVPLTGLIMSPAIADTARGPRAVAAPQGGR
jgi:hypothetical protein